MSNDRIAVVAGEASSDLLASHLIRSLRRARPGLQFFGIGGERMAAEGCEIRHSCERLAVHGYAEALGRYWELSRLRKNFLAELLADPPAALIGVDAPDFNLWLERKAKEAGIPAIHFVSPSIWAWRGGRIHTISRSVSHMLCLFPFEPPLYQAAGVPVSFVGHPLADEFPLCPDRAAARQALGIDADATVFALLPGSRQSEVRRLGPLFVDTARELARRHPQAIFLLPLATPETQDLFFAVQSAAQEQGPLPEIRVLRGDSVRAMTAANVVLVASGTASLEAALLKRPMVITYKTGRWSYPLLRRMAYLPWIGLPNILCGQTVVPELIQDQATPQALALALDAWLQQPESCAALEARFLDLHRSLRQDTASKAAAAILPLLQGAGR